MFGGLLGGLGDDRDLQPAADCFSDLSEWDALFRDGVIPGSRGSLLERKPVEAGSIEHVHCGPAVEPVTNVRGDALFPSYCDQVGDEALLAVVVDLREADH